MRRQHHGELAGAAPCGALPDAGAGLAGGQPPLAYSLALKSDGTVWAWGDNDKGQLGDGTTISRDLPEKIASLTGVTRLVAGAAASYAIQAGGTLLAWGDASSGLLGNGATQGFSATAGAGPGPHRGHRGGHLPDHHAGRHRAVGPALGVGRELNRGYGRSGTAPPRRGTSPPRPACRRDPGRLRGHRQRCGSSRPAPGAAHPTGPAPGGVPGRPGASAGSTPTRAHPNVRFSITAAARWVGSARSPSACPSVTRAPGT